MIKKLVFNETIKVWDEAIPLGNGAMGCLIWGNSDSLRFSLDRCDMWVTDGAPVPGGEFLYSNLVKLGKEGNIDEVTRIFESPYSNPSPTKLPAGKIIIDMGVRANVVSRLDIEKAEAEICADDVVIKSFLDANVEVGYIKINTESPGIRLENPVYGKAGEKKPEDRNSLKNLVFDEAEYIKESYEDGIFLAFTQKINDEFTYGLFVKTQVSQGQTLIAYTVQPGKNAEEITSRASALLDGALNSGYKDSLISHTAWWNEYWSKSYIDLEDELFERMWYISNYLLGSCSRKGYYPMPLQGVWTADDGKLPPWKGDYHHDLNTQLSYYSYLKANHLPEGECFLDYLFSMEGVFEKFAKEFYGAEGLCIPSVMDIEGNPLGGWAVYSLSPTNTGWICSEMYDYYKYTKDDEYLREKAYPFIRKHGEFLVSILKENEEGKLVLPISSSPEIHDNLKESYITPNSTYDLSLIRKTFENLIRISEYFGDSAEAEKWEEYLGKMDEYPVDTDGCLMLSRDERLEESHRHFSHLMPIHPLRQIRYETMDEKRIIDASIASLEELGIFYYVGYSFCWRAELYAVQKNGEKAHEMLDTFWNYFCLPNGFHCNGDYKNKLGMNWTYRPFTLEANMCAADALQEMLLFDGDGEVEIAPAVPESWKNYSFKLRSSNGAVLTVKIEDGKVVSIVADAYTPCDFKVKYKGEVVANIKSGQD